MKTPKSTSQKKCKKMNENDYITDFMTWSYSNASTFVNCAHAWKLSYLDKNKRYGNYFSDFGLLLHKAFELFWEGELDIFDLPSYYEDSYHLFVTHPPPPFLAQYGIEKKNFDNGMQFLLDLDWDRESYEILGNEMTIDCSYKDVALTVRPDLVLREKTSGKVILADYKTSTPFKKTKSDDGSDIFGEPIQEKIDPYIKQMSLYAFFFERDTGIHVDTMRIYFPKLSLAKTINIEYNNRVGQDAVDWWYETVQKAKAEESFPASINDFFCGNLCGVRASCEPYNNYVKEKIKKKDAKKNG